MNRRGAFLLLVAGLAALPARTQGVADAVEAIDRARVVTRVLYVDAHPDDESSSVLTYLSRGLHADAALLSVTRGEGGQNAIGPEQGPELAILRTAELQAATQQYGVQLYLTRAPDFGYSKSAEQTLRIWRDFALVDIVRVIRTFRPQILINEWGGVTWGHGQHQATGILTPQAVVAAADPKFAPEQLAEGLTPWRVSKVVELSRGEGPPEGGWRVPAEQISPLRGESYTGIGLRGFANHRSQGVTAFLGASFFHRPIYIVPLKNEKFDPQSLAEPLASLAGRFPPLADMLRPALEDADGKLASARAAALELNWAEAARQLAAAGKGIAAVEARVAATAAPDDATAAALAELRRVRARIDRALELATATHLEAWADRSELVAGESFSVDLPVLQTRTDAGVVLGDPALLVPAGWKVAGPQTAAEGAHFTVAIPAGARPPSSPQDAILPWPEPLVRAQVKASVAGYTFAVEAPVQSRRATSTRVDVLSLELVPAVTLTLEPQQLLLRQNQPARTLELLARVTYHGATAADVAAGLAPPQGWRVSSPVTLRFTEPGDRLARFELIPPERPAAGAYRLEPYARLGAQTFHSSIETLPTLPTRFWEHPAEAAVHVLDLVVPANLRIGYVAAENDPIPEALRQLGIHVELLDEASLAFDDLSRFNAIAVGIRAYELRDDLVRANPRLLNYVAAGGTLLVQYEKDFVWNKLSPAPFPASMGDHGPRITNAKSPVRFVAPDNPALNFPNKITQADFEGWVQERGLYFWKTFDARYQPVLAMRDPGEGEELGGLVYARDVKGVYIYTGLSFFRQLPAGVPGAYRLFINLLSQSLAKP